MAIDIATVRKYLDEDPVAVRKAIAQCICIAMTNKSNALRDATREFFATNYGEWHTIRDVAKYLGMNIQATRYYVYHLEDLGLLETTSQKVADRDGIKRTTKHYRKAIF